MSTRHARGMTLLELLMAMVVLSIGLVGLLGLFSMSNTLNGRARDSMFAVDVAGRALEEVRGLPFDQIPASNEYDTSIEGRSLMHVAVTAEVDPTYADLKRVRVRVDWNQRSNGHLELETIVGAPLT